MGAAVQGHADVGPGRAHPETGVIIPPPVSAGDAALYGKYAGPTVDDKASPRVNKYTDISPGRPMCPATQAGAAPQRGW